MSEAKTELPWSKHIPDQTFDVIVIGSGMGGMTAAATLASVGKRVLVLEQHYVPGGFTHTFRRPGYVWDVGVHAVGEVTEHSMSGRVLKHITDGRLKWASLGEVYDDFRYPDGFEIGFPDSPQKFKAALYDAFPNERDAIDDYFHLVRSVAGAMKGYYLARLAPKLAGPVLNRTAAKEAQRYLGMRALEVVASLTDNPRLQSVFTAQWGYYGAPPRRASFAMQALVTKHFMHGGYYPVGGSQEIAVQLLETVKQAGGATAIRADVEEILVERERAVGVRLTDGREVRAKQILSAAGVQSTVTRLLPEAYRQKSWARSIANLEPSPAHVCLYLGLKGDIASAGAGSANQWFYETYDLDQEVWNVGIDGTNEDAPILYCSFPSLKDPLHDPGPEQRHTAEVVTFVPYGLFAPHENTRWGKRDPEYKALKEQLSERLLNHLLRYRPDLGPMVDHVELSTPASTHHFVRPVRGGIYGLAPTPARFENEDLRPTSPIKGLTFGGSEVATVGVIGAMMGGLLGAAATSPKDVLPMVYKLVRR